METKLPLLDFDFQLRLADDLSCKLCNKTIKMPVFLGSDTGIPLRNAACFVAQQNPFACARGRCLNRFRVFPIRDLEGTVRCVDGRGSVPAARMCELRATGTLPLPRGDESWATGTLPLPGGDESRATGTLPLPFYRSCFFKGLTLQNLGI